MRVAAITFVFNEAINLPIWTRYYGANFGTRNLFVIDRESTDGSTADLGEVNKLKVPRIAFDEWQKTGFIATFYRSLLHFYDAVIYTDCDEIIVPDPARYASLREYVERMEADYATCVGLNVQHLITHEAPLDSGAPVLAQRDYARFLSPSCKTLISRSPIDWLPGFHCCDRPPRIDPELFMFHTKLMDYTVAMRRQRINRETEWSSVSLEQQLGAHHRYEYAQFVRECFLDPVNMMNHDRIGPFDFAAEIAALNARVVEKDRHFYVPMDIGGPLVRIPERFRPAF